MFVHESLYEGFIDGLADRADEITVGDPLDPNTELGSLAFREQWEKVTKYIDIGEQEGSTVKYGGEAPADAPGECFIQPTILVNVENEMQVAQEEIFGPVASVITFEDEEEVIELANDTRYGLAAGVWTSEIPQAYRVADALEAGIVWINEYRRASHRAPLGGFKDSGIGRENGEEVLNEYRQTKTVWIDLAGEVSNPFQLN